jgi:CBS domain-containing protein
MIESVHLSEILGRSLTSEAGDRLGRLDDLIVRLRGDDYPVVTGVVAKLGNLRLYIPASHLGGLGADEIVLSTPQADLRPFERRNGEVLLKEDILGHRLIDVEDGRLIRAGDLVVEHTDEGWELRGVDTRARSRVFHRVHPRSGHRFRDWKLFEPLMGHKASAMVRAPFRRLKRLKPAQLADLLEEASKEEWTEILEDVHADPELEADVFEELDPDIANRLFGDKSDSEVADVLARMRADDAADAIAELPQERRERVLELLPLATRARLVVLLGFNASTAGGLMGIEYLAVGEETTAEGAIARVRQASNAQCEALSTVYTVDEQGRLTGAVPVIEVLRADSKTAVGSLVDRQAVCVLPSTDLSDISILMADYNLVAIPVVDDDDHLLGLVTVDDVLEALIPDDWRRRQPSPRPEHPRNVPAETSS